LTTSASRAVIGTGRAQLVGADRGYPDHGASRRTDDLPATNQRRSGRQTAAAATSHSPGKQTASRIFTFSGQITFVRFRILSGVGLCLAVVVARPCGVFCVRRGDAMWGGGVDRGQVGGGERNVGGRRVQLQPAAPLRAGMGTVSCAMTQARASWLVLTPRCWASWLRVSTIATLRAMFSAGEPGQVAAGVVGCEGPSTLVIRR